MLQDCSTMRKGEIDHMPDEVLLSPQGYQKIKEQLSYLQNTRRRELAEKIRKARSLGDLSENAEYDATKDEQGKMESKIAHLKSILQQARIVHKEDVDAERVNVGSQVTITNKEDGQTFSYTIVGAMEADPSSQRISYQSPVGKAVYGKTEGEEVQVRLPGGKTMYRIDEVKWTGGNGPDNEQEDEHSAD